MEENLNKDLQEPKKTGDTATDIEIEKDAEESVDYAELVREDVLALAAEFPELANLSDVTELDDPLRYAALRDLGLSPAEAYLATAKRRRKTDNRAHLYASAFKAAVPSGSMPERELMAAREIFTDISDADIRRLYKKVTK